jgi:hypothetical protein
MLSRKVFLLSRKGFYLVQSIRRIVRAHEADLRDAGAVATEDLRGASGLCKQR